MISILFSTLVFVQSSFGFTVECENKKESIVVQANVRDGNVENLSVQRGQESYPVTSTVTTQTSFFGTSMYEVRWGIVRYFDFNRSGDSRTGGGAILLHENPFAFDSGLDCRFQD